ncbi:MAG: MBOAT family O-acyltransferase, partial [Candidatus Methylumidiphilus sp.]
MVFSSVTFLFYFLPIFFLLYYLLPFRNATLLLASLVFYAWGELDNLWILLISIAGNYTSGLAISVAQAYGEKGGRALAAGIVINLAVLAYFKYFNLLIATAADVAPLFGIPAPQAEHVPLPLGISFFTFHALSYLVDVYRRKTPVERSLIGLAMYITMFPQLVAGPIIRYSTIAGQIHKRRMTLGRIELGIQIFIVGLAQKVLIANTVALPADQIFSLDPSALTMATAWLGTICYTLQIYFDFGGYSNMAIGLGLMTGFTFPRNFNYPYISQSITEFWRRWHITLSRWFRDYLYIPLGGNRKSPWRTYANLFTVFFLCGLWHGASWTFVFWGMYHGLFLVLERAGLEALLAKLWRPVRHLYALLVVMVGWVFFRSDSFEKAIAMLKSMAGMAQGDPIMTPLAFYLTHSVFVAIVIGCLASCPLCDALKRLMPKQRKLVYPGLRQNLMSASWRMINSAAF